MAVQFHKVFCMWSSVLTFSGCFIWRPANQEPSQMAVGETLRTEKVTHSCWVNQLLHPQINVYFWCQCRHISIPLPLSGNSNNTFIRIWRRDCENQTSHYLIFVRHSRSAVVKSKLEKYKATLVSLPSVQMSVVEGRHWACQGGWEGKKFGRWLFEISTLLPKHWIRKRSGGKKKIVLPTRGGQNEASVCNSPLSIIF